MRSLTLVLSLLLILIAAAALADPAGKARRGPAPNAPATARDHYGEMEPNDDCSQANPVDLGDLIDGDIAPWGEHDYFELTVEAGTGVYIRTILSGGGDQLQDSELTVFDDDCATVLAYCDDAVGLESEILHTFEQAGSYYIMVKSYGDGGDGEYQLAVEPAVILPAGDTCEESTGLLQGLHTYTSSTWGMNDDYDFNGYGGGAPDVAFGLSLPPGANFNCELEILGGDMIFFLVADCGDIGSYVAFSDGDPEEINYTNETFSTQTLYLIVDGYDFEQSMGAGFKLWYSNEGSPVVVEPGSWSDLKGRY